MKLSINPNECVSCGACAGNYPEYFEIKEDGKAHLINPKGVESDGREYQTIDDNDPVKEAVSGCPVGTIKAE